MGDNSATTKPVIKSPLTALHKGKQEGGSSSEPHPQGQHKQAGGEVPSAAGDSGLTSGFHKVTRSSDRSNKLSLKQLQLKYKASKEEKERQTDPHSVTRVQEIQEDKSNNSSGDDMSPRPSDEPRGHRSEIHHGGLHHNMHHTTNTTSNSNKASPYQDHTASPAASSTATIESQNKRIPEPGKLSNNNDQLVDQSGDHLQTGKNEETKQHQHQQQTNATATATTPPSTVKTGLKSKGGALLVEPVYTLYTDSSAVTMSEMPESQPPTTNTLQRSKSDSTETDKPPLIHRNTWNGNDPHSNPTATPSNSKTITTNHLTSSKIPTSESGQSQPSSAEKLSPRTQPSKGPLKAPASKPDDSPRTESPDEISVSLDGVPEPPKQREVISQVSSECTCSYAVLKSWYRRWEEYVGLHKVPPTGGGVEPPGPLEMDNHNDANNEYVSEEAWRHLIKWYGISDTHQLDRKHLYFKDEKMFDICTLSPFSGIVEHTVKKFNRFEEIGYIECQLRRVFHVADHKRTRMWISEKAQVPRFRQLLLRFRMLNDCIHRDKMYILALEEGLSGDGWPTGEPGEPKGELTKYAALVTGYKAQDHWSTHIEDSLDTLSVSLGDSLRNMAESFMKNGRDLIEERETQLLSTRNALEQKLEETKQKEKFLDEKTKEVTKQEEKLRQDRQALMAERAEFEAREKKFREEVEMMESINKIQENKIKLDIGGQIHTTSLQTLRKDPESMLSAMFSGRHSLQKEPDGSYFIDRDHSYFRYILNFLRDGTIEQGTLPTKVYALREILREARYYQLSGLVNYLEEIIQERSSGSSS